MKIQNNCFYLFLSFLVFINNPIIGQNYYGIDGYSKIILQNDSFTLDFFEINWHGGNGTYKMDGDTIYLTSKVQPIEIINCDSCPLPKNYIFKLPMRIYDENGMCLEREEEVRMDSVSGYIYLFDFQLNEGQVIEVEYFEVNSLIWPYDIDTPSNYYLRIDASYGKAAYFNKFPMLKKGNFLLPFSKYDNNNFKKINKFDILAFEKGPAKKKFKKRRGTLGIVD